MYRKLFQIALVLFLVVVSVAMLGLVITILRSVLAPKLVAESGGFSFGITWAAGGVTDTQLGYMIVAASLIIAGCYVFFRRRRFRR